MADRDESSVVVSTPGDRRPRRTARRGARAVLGAVLALTALAGCGASEPSTLEDPCAAKPADVQGVARHEVEVGGDTRAYAVNVPASYRGENPTPVVVLFHGGGQDAASFAATSRMKEESDRRGFILAAPQAAGDERYFNFASPDDDDDSDVPLADAVLDDLEERFCVAEDRVYAAGFSLGSALVFALACDASPRFAAYAGSSAILPPRDCAEAPPASIVYFHGTKDRIVPAGGIAAEDLDVDVFGIDSVPPVTTALAAWAKHDECEDTPARTNLAKDVQQFRWSRCAGSTDLLAYSIVGGGHQWPGGDPAGASPDNGVQTRSVGAAALMWKFFSPRRLEPVDGEDAS